MFISQVPANISLCFLPRGKRKHNLAECAELQRCARGVREEMFKRDLKLFSFSCHCSVWRGELSQPGTLIPTPKLTPKVAAELAQLRAAVLTAALL